MASHPVSSQPGAVTADVPDALAALAASMPQLGRRPAVELAVVIPTYNERDNVAELVDRLEAALTGVRYEILFVDDDSPDGTAQAVRDLAAQKPWVRVIQRIGRRGLSSACIEGMMATAAPAIAVMDADLQHDERILPRMLAELRHDGCDVVIGTRNAAGGSKGDMRNWRVRLSDWGLKASKLATRTEISDPMSGFFLVDRRFVDEVVRRTSGVGFKILVDLVASARRPVKSAEVPYRFRVREHGESKLSLNVGLEYLYLLLDKIFGDYVPVRFVLYGAVGAVGVGLHLSMLAGLLRGGVSFAMAQVTATAVAMTANFLLNNTVTHRDVKLKGWRLVPGLATFYLACAIGLVTNLSVSERLLNMGVNWLWSGVAGLAVTSVWNYGVTSVLTWRRLKRNLERR